MVRFHCITIQEMKPSFGLISRSQWLGHLQDRKRDKFSKYTQTIFGFTYKIIGNFYHTVRLFCPYEHTTSIGSIMVVLRYVLTRRRALNDRSLA